MKLLVSPEGNFLRFKPVRIDPTTGKFKEAPKAVNVRTKVIATFGECHVPGVMTLELDSRSCPSEDDGTPAMYFVRAKESEIRGALGLKVYGEVKGFA